MKKTISIIVALSLALTALCACSKKSENTVEYVKLCDYKNLTINLDEYKATDEEVTTAIQMRMFEQNILEPINGVIEDGDFVQLNISKNNGDNEMISFFIGNEEYTNGFDEHLLGHSADESISFNIENDSYDITIVSVKRTPLEITDEIANKYFEVKNANEVINETKQKIAENRFFEAVRDIVLTQSQIIQFPDYCYDYVDKVVGEHKLQAQNEGKNSDDYFNDIFQMSEGEYREAVLWGYGDYLILKEFADYEGYVISDEEMNNLIKHTANLDENTYEETKEQYGEEYFEYILFESFFKDFIVEMYSEQIGKCL